MGPIRNTLTYGLFLKLFIYTPTSYLHKGILHYNHNHTAFNQWLTALGDLFIPEDRDHFKELNNIPHCMDRL